MLTSAIDLYTEDKKLGPQGRFAREWFAKHGPADAPPLPLSYGERERLKRGDLGHLVALYARSLALQDYDVEKHPSFHHYACGVIASDRFRWDDQDLPRRFPARPLVGLDNGLYWSPPKSMTINARAASKRSPVRRAH
jgi:hypothetical protein